MFTGKRVVTVNDPQANLILPTHGINSMGIIDGHSFVLFAMDQQDRTAHSGD